MAYIKNILIIAVLGLFSNQLAAQITTGRIVFERKTNLEKRFGDNPRMKQMITEENKYRIENFELLFNDTMSVFRPIPSDEAEEGFLKFLTQQNTVYQNLNTREKFISMDLWGNPTYIKDTMDNRQWKITESKRNLGGHMCRKTLWEMNDSTRIYAWFASDIVPSVGPEGFQGLPGAILGLATEDGSIIYFAKEVQVMEVPLETLLYDDNKKDVYTEDELKEILKEKMGKWVKPEDLEAMFSWL